MKSPAERYIRYLLLLPDGLDNQQIVRRLQEEDLDPISPGYVNRLRESIRTPTPYYPFDPRHRASVTFNRSQGVQYLMQPRREEKLASQILMTSRAKELVESMSMTGMTPARVSVALATMKRFRAVEECHVASYLYHYFDVEEISATELRAIIRVRMSSVGTSSEDTSPERTLMAEALRKESYRSSQRLAATMPHSPVAGLIAMVQQGYNPTTLQMNEVLQQTKALLTLRGFEEACSNNPEMPMRIGGIYAAIESIDRTIERSQDPSGKLRAQIDALRMKTGKKSVPTVTALTGGRVSTPMLGPKDTTNGESDAAGSVQRADP